MESTTDSCSTTPTINVGGAIFSTTKQQQLSHNHDDHNGDLAARSTQQQTESTILVAKGKSHLSYFYVSVCSSVLYLAPETSADDNAILSYDGGDDSSSSSTNASSPVALEIYYHRAVRAEDLRWATLAYMEKNLRDGKSYSDLPLMMQQQISKFNDLYQNVKPGDRYLLSYIPGNGVTLQLNDELLGIVGMDLPSEQQQQDLARLIYSVWFGHSAPFSESMKKDLLTPLDPIEQQLMENPALLLNGIPNATIKRDNAILSTSSNQAIQNAILSTSSNQKSSNSMTKEESELLDSLGILQLLEEEKDSAPIQRSETITYTTKQSQLPSKQPSPEFDQSSSTMSRIRNLIFPPKTLPLHSERKFTNKTSNDGFKQPVTAVTHSTPDSSSTINYTDIAEDEYKYNPILLGLGGALFLLPHLAVLLSLPPVLQRRGAPYLPTFGGKLNTMFDLIRNHTLRHSKQQQQHQRTTTTTATPLLRFVDLGSGDGRVVFRAAREGTFARSTGYEINPALHLFACCRRMVTPKYWYNTDFYVRDLWKVKLRDYDVVAVYGLSPIMERLGEKMKEELRPGSIVVSNVFAIPGWRVSDDGGKGGGKGVFLYRVPECFGGKK